MKELKAKSIAIIDDRSAYGQGVADEFVKAAKAAGGKIVGREYTNDKATDFNAILTKLKGAKPDLVFFGGMDAVAGPMLRQMKQLGIEVKFMGGDGICSGELPKLAGDALGDGQVVCAEAGGVDRRQGQGDGTTSGRASRASSTWTCRSTRPTSTTPSMTMVAAMQKANSADPKKYLPELAKISYDGVTGKIAFDDKGDIKDGALTLYTYKGGKREQMMVVK